MLDMLKVKAAVADGMSAVCATCTKYWRARDKGVAGHRCLSQDGCASPLGGGDFHEYEGPITYFDKQCFVCGGLPKFGCRTNNSVRVIAVCEKHIELFSRLKPMGMKAPAPPTVHANNGVPVPESMLKPYAKKTLGQAIHEVEAHYAEKEGREL